MKHVLVPFLTPDDVSASAKVVTQLKAARPISVVVLNNPSLGVSPEGATAKIDKDIADLERAKSEAVAREDFEGAKAFKSQIEDKKTERQDAMRTGWKAVPMEERYRAYDKLVQPFADAFNGTGVYVENIVLEEDTSYEMLFSSLTLMKARWPQCLPEGEWSLLFPQDASEPVSSTPAHPVQAVSPALRVETAKPATKAQKSAPAKPAAPSTPDELREYYRKYFMSLKKDAKAASLTLTSENKTQVIEELVSLRFSPVERTA